MPWDSLTADQQANLGMGSNPFLGQSNPYMEKLIQDSSQDVVNNYNLSTQPAFNRAMVNSGSFGNEGVQQMNMQAQDQLQKNLGSLSNAQRSADYQQQQQMYQWQQGLLNQKDEFGRNLGENQRQWDTGLAEKQREYDLGYGENQRQFDMGFGRNVFNDAYSQNMNNLQMGMGMLGTMSGYNGTDLNNANAQQNTPLDYWSKFNQQGNSLGQGYGTDTTTQGTSSNPWMSALGGAQMGSQLGQGVMGWWNNYNNQQGAGITGTGGGNAGGGYNTGMTLNNNFGGTPNNFGLV